MAIISASDFFVLKWKQPQTSVEVEHSCELPLVGGES
jgi:hypothetical protein